MAKVAHLFQFEYHGIDGKTISLCGFDRFHHAIFLGAQDILHFHGLDNSERLAFDHRIAFGNVQRD